MSLLAILVLFLVIPTSYTVTPECSGNHVLTNLLEKVTRIETKIDEVSSGLTKDTECVRNEQDADQTIPGKAESDVIGRIKDLEDTLKAATIKIELLQGQVDLYSFQAANPSTRKVAFSAYIDENQSIDIGDVIVFNHILTNQGNHFSPKTGRFTAPQKGIYHFTWHAMSQSNSVTCLVVNGKCMVHAFIGAGAIKEILPDGNSAILRLEKNDKVAVRVILGTQLYAHKDRRYVTFSGFSL